MNSEKEKDNKKKKNSNKKKKPENKCSNEEKFNINEVTNDISSLPSSNDYIESNLKKKKKKKCEENNMKEEGKKKDYAPSEEYVLPDELKQESSKKIKKQMSNTLNEKFNVKKEKGEYDSMELYENNKKGKKEKKKKEKNKEKNVEIKENKDKEKKKVRFKEDEITTENILNYFIDNFNNNINIEHDELCQLLTGKKFYDIERLAKNATDITHYSIMNKNIQKEKESYCKNCGYIYNYDDYIYMYIKIFNSLKLDEKEAAYDSIKCIYCGTIIDDVELQNQYNDKENYIELHSYREKYVFDKNKKKYWKNKIISLDKNTSLFKEEKNKAYNITYEKCTECGNDFLHFINIQTRSADEGSTIIYFCPQCKKQTTVYN
ncbi:transcription factor, putative [Plasmodium relictum]|uniref:Transcription factor, putative n=1 Tax=Plasmodium relictum TaxID=85471 RepID=A0A1J1H4N8_PLARL|nr:transcription factor, putative [Plasmodium relictum]CRG98560.1 transcription factor, putative [Plasmodium relictum]